MKLLLALFFATTLTVAAQSPEVPHKMRFADLTLTIRDDARREIQKDVDALTRYTKSFNIKVERAKTYFPIIERIFAEENVPDDFKYLVIQESALIPDAVSVSNAVGFWQFKDFTAIEMGLRVDKQIDERMNIVSSSRAAARYLKKNNTFFDNWLFALQAYQMGAGGVMRSEKETKGGSKHLEITSKTYWYVKKYLAHKIAYEAAINGEGEIKVLTYHTRNKKSTLSEIAQEVSVDETEMKNYNKWLKSHTIPDDRSYAVMIPVRGPASQVKMPESATASASADATIALRETAKPRAQIKKNQDKVKINGIVAIKAGHNETPTKLAARAGVDLSAFLKYNDISISDRVEPGQHFFLTKKRNRASSPYHKLVTGESLWSVSQQYGVQMKKLKRYNRIQSDVDLKPGMTLWLAGMKPKDADKFESSGPIVEVANESFNWDTGSGPTESTSKETEKESTSEVAKVIQNEPEKVAEVKSVEVINNDGPAEIVTESVDSLQNLQANSESTNEVQVTSEPDLKNQGEPSKKEHIVQLKETLYGIARQYGVGVMDLVNWNKLDLQQGIKPGQVLKVVEPQDIANEPENVTASTITEHEVKSSDTVYSIARKYGVTIKELMEWNGKKDFTLAVGEKLKIIKK